MTDRGEQTLVRLIEATQQVVAEVGYHKATTRRIARAAGVTEGAIYRHFPDKTALLLAAVLHRQPVIVEELAALPARAGQASVVDNLVEALATLAKLRVDVLPLEMALLSDPELTARGLPADSEALKAQLAQVEGPPRFVADYLRAEQALGRVRAGTDTDVAAMALLAALFGLSVRWANAAGGVDPSLLRPVIELMAEGMAHSTESRGD